MIVYRNPGDRMRFVLYEVWRDRKDFETVQMKRSYRRKYEESLRQNDVLRSVRPHGDDKIFRRDPGVIRV